jgi:integration host factor subunit alpha
MSTLNKITMVEGLCDELGLSKPEARLIIEEFFEEIAQELIAGYPVKLSGFGNFKLRNKSARPGRNPKTGKPTLISPRRVVTFKAGLTFKNEIKK